MPDAPFNVAIIGGGVVGCALARELSTRFSRVLLVEKEPAVALHTSGRNSGVIHSGFNATPGSLKAQLCVEGNLRLRTYCRDHKVPYEEVGTWVVATNQQDMTRLVVLKAKGEENGVPGLEIVSGSELRKHEPNARGEAALFSPTGSIVDSSYLTHQLAQEAIAQGTTLQMSCEVLGFDEQQDVIHLQTTRGRFTAHLVINCAGLHSDRLAHRMGLGRQYTVAPFRGEYFAVKPSSAPLIRSMLYHVPNPLFPFLGIHVTRTIEGAVLLGPNAVPAFGREAYKPTQFNLRDLGELLIHQAFWNALRTNRALFKLGVEELRHSYNLRHFLKEASTLVAGLTVENLIPEGRVGIRPQLIRADGTLVDDLVIETTPRSIHILNVVSPGMTCSLAFSNWVSTRINNQFQWSKQSGLG